MSNLNFGIKVQYAGSDPQVLSWFNESEIDRYFNLVFQQVKVEVFGVIPTNSSSRTITRSDLGVRKCVGEALPAANLSDFNCPLANYTALLKGGF